MKRLLLSVFTIVMAAFGVLAECTDPNFKGGDEKLQQWFVKKMKYPQEALVMEKSGSVTFEVTISEKGKVADYTVVQSTDPVFTEEAVRLIEKMPKWKPAVCDGQKSDGKVTVIVNFDPYSWLSRHRKSGNWFGTAGAGVGFSF